MNRKRSASSNNQGVQRTVSYALRNITNNESREILTRSKSRLFNTKEINRNSLQRKPLNKIKEMPKKTAKLHVESPAKPIAGPSNQTAVQQVKPPNTSCSSDVLEQFRKIKDILGAKYANVVDRLKLKYTPYCVENMEYCKTHHSKKCPRPSVVDIYQSRTAKHLADHHRIFPFLKFVEDMCIRTEFPGDYIITRLWEIILTINPCESDKYTAKDAIDECVLIFEIVLHKFPPCWYDIRDSYCKVLTDPLNMENVVENGTWSNENIMRFIITKLREIMCEEDDGAIGINNTNDEFFNLQDWEMKNDPGHSFQNLSRTDKLDRLFVILHMITMLLELDLSIWILRHLSNCYKSIFEDEKKPLVCVVFGIDKVTQVTNLVKDTIQVFVCCACFSYPSDELDVLSRLIALLSVIINLCENYPLPKGIQYPNVGRLTQDFTREVFKAIDSYVGPSVPYYLAVIDQLKIPFIKYIFINQLLYKMNPDRGEMCIKKILENFNKKRWLECDLHLNEEFFSPNRNSSCKYPVIPKNFSKPKRTPISRIQYLDVLLKALEAYCDAFEVKKVALIFNPKINQKTNSEEVRKQMCSKIAKVKKWNLHLLESDINELVLSLKMKQKRLPNELEIPKWDRIYFDDKVMLYYKEQLKSLTFLQKKISILREEHGNILDKFFNFINEVFSINEV